MTTTRFTSHVLSSLLLGWLSSPVTLSSDTNTQTTTLVPGVSTDAGTLAYSRPEAWTSGTRGDSYVVSGYVHGGFSIPDGDTTASFAPDPAGSLGTPVMTVSDAVTGHPAKDLLRRIPTAEGDVEVKVRVAQVGRVPEEVQQIAQTTVLLLYSRIGVTVRFTNEPSEMDTEAIALQVWERAPGGIGPYVMGSAWIGGRRGRRANAFYDRLEVFAGGSGPRDTGILLGYVMAHELGHVLRAEPGHSPSGVMKACWGQRDVPWMLHEAVSFSRADAKRIIDVIEERRLAGVRTGEN